MLSMEAIALELNSLSTKGSLIANFFALISQQI